MSEKPNKTPVLETVEPIGKRILIRKDEDKKETKGGIRLPDNIEIPTITGRIVAVSAEVDIMPEIPLARYDKVLFNPKGAIPVDFSQRTSIENIYAAGDCCESFHRVSRRWVNVPLGDIANKQGRVAGRNIGGRPMTFDGIVGAQSFRLFSLQCAAAGLSEREAIAAGFSPASHVAWGSAMAPALGMRKIGLKLTADRSTGRLLGAQAVGAAGAVGRINALSVALWAGMDLDQVGYLDLAYSPPFSPAWDIIHNAAQALGRSL